MKWSDTLSIGIPGIDEQHKTVIDCINQLEAADGKAARDVAVRHAMEQLDEYVREHFYAEEMLMRLFHFPHLDAHLREHHEFAGHLALLRRNHHARNMHLQAAKFLRGWWANHIMVVDRKYADFIAGRPVAEARRPRPGAKH